MAVLHIIIAALAQSSVSGGTTTPVASTPEVEVVGPQRQVICRQVTMSNSRIPVRRVCQTAAQIEAQRDEAQSDADRALDLTNRRNNESQANSGYGNWSRDRSPRPLGEARPR